jgi:hypothetical protein
MRKLQLRIAIMEAVLGITRFFAGYANFLAMRSVLSSIARVEEHRVAHPLFRVHGRYRALLLRVEASCFYRRAGRLEHVKHFGASYEVVGLRKE